MLFARQRGHWRPNIQIQGYSPGFEVNDIGFGPRSDIVATHAMIQYINETPRGRIRRHNWWLSKYQNWNYDGDVLTNGIYGYSTLDLTNYWTVVNWGRYALAHPDDRKSRGGPNVHRPPDYGTGITVITDPRRRISAEAALEQRGERDGTYSRIHRITLNYRPTTALRVSLATSYTRGVDRAQYVTTTSEPEYIFSTIDQRTLDVGGRIDWVMSPRLSFQLYAQPFVGAGEYHDFKRLSGADVNDFTPTDSPIDPDFNLRSLRASAVFRWELRPGSALYVVWNDNRRTTLADGDFRIGRDLRAIPNAPSQDVFLIKFAYWLPL